MPHTLSWRERGLVRTFTGSVTGTEILESNFKMHGDYRFDHIGYVINDFSQMELCTIADDELSLLSITDEIATGANSHLNIAIIVTRQEFIDLAQIYCKMMRDATYDAEIFDNLKDAQEWVDSQPDE